MSDTSTNTSLPGDRSRAEYVYAQLKLRLRNGEFRAGQRLREVDLADMLHVSRTPVREALRRIASDGLVQVVAGRGLIVAEFDHQQVRELYSLQRLLEGGAAALAARFATPSDIAAMQEILARSAAKLRFPQETKKLNVQFHRTIHQAARNAYLEQALAQMSDSLGLLPGTTFTTPGRTQAALLEHRAIAEAIEHHDAEGAERSARLHIDNAASVRLKMMFARTPSS